MNPRSLVIIAAAAVGLTFVAADVAACSYPGGPASFSVDSDVDVSGQLEQPTLQVASIDRGQGPRGGPFTHVSSNCDYLGRISLDVAPEPEDVGYVFEVTDGEVPGGAAFPETPISLNYSGKVDIRWDDGAKDKQEPFEFTVQVTPIAKDGEPGPTSEPITVSDAGSGCSTAGQGGAPGGAWLLVLAAAGLVWRVDGR